MPNQNNLTEAQKLQRTIVISIPWAKKAQVRQSGTPVKTL